MIKRAAEVQPGDIVRGVGAVVSSVTRDDAMLPKHYRQILQRQEIVFEGGRCRTYDPDFPVEIVEPEEEKPKATRRFGSILAPKAAERIKILAGSTSGPCATTPMDEKLAAAGLVEIAERDGEDGKKVRETSLTPDGWAAEEDL